MTSRHRGGRLGFLLLPPIRGIKSMAHPAPNKFRNRILNGLAPNDRTLVQQHLRPVALPRHKTLETANKKIDYIYFPDCGLVSLVGGPTKAGREVEIGIIGSEGMTGLPVIYGDDRSPHRIFMQIAGDGHRIPANILRRAFDHSVTLRHRLLKYAQAFMIHTTYTAIANARGTLQQRLSRWILMAQDRVGSGEIPMTHE